MSSANQVKVTNQVIAKNLVKSIEKLLNATVTHQVVTDSYGKSENRIIITYEQEVQDNS